MSSVSPVGTLAFVVEEEALLVRVEAGWQYVAVSTLSIYLHLFISTGRLGYMVGLLHSSTWVSSPPMTGVGQAKSMDPLLFDRRAVQ